MTALLISNLLWHVDANDVVVVLDVVVVVADGVAVVVAVDVQVSAHWTEE